MWWGQKHVGHNPEPEIAASHDFQNRPSFDRPRVVCFQEALLRKSTLCITSVAELSGFNSWLVVRSSSHTPRPYLPHVHCAVMSIKSVPWLRVHDLLEGRCAARLIITWFQTWTKNVIFPLPPPHYLVLQVAIKIIDKTQLNPTSLQKVNTKSLTHSLSIPFALSLCQCSVGVSIPISVDRHARYYGSPHGMDASHG